MVDSRARTAVRIAVPPTPSFSFMLQTSVYKGEKQMWCSTEEPVAIEILSKYHPALYIHRKLTSNECATFVHDEHSALRSNRNRSRNNPWEF